MDNICDYILFGVGLAFGLFFLCFTAFNPIESMFADILLRLLSAAVVFILGAALTLMLLEKENNNV